MTTPHRRLSLAFLALSALSGCLGAAETTDSDAAASSRDASTGGVSTDSGAPGADGGSHGRDAMPNLDAASSGDASARDASADAGVPGVDGGSQGADAGAFDGSPGCGASSPAACPACAEGPIATPCRCDAAYRESGYCCAGAFQAAACAPLADCATAPLRTTGTVYYYCDCAEGLLGGPADPACIPGDDSDSNPGTDPAAPRRSLSDAESRFNDMAAGDTVALCRGGVFSGGLNLTNPRCTKAQPCDLRDYVPSWGSLQTPRPRLSSGGTTIAVQDAPARGNYRIWNIDSRNPATGGANGVILVYNGSFHDLDFCNLRVEGGWLGVYFEPTDTTPNNLTLRNSQIFNGQFSGFYGGSPGVTITGNHFEGNGVYTGSGGMLMHSVYLISEVGGFPSEASVPASYVFSGNSIVEGAYCDGVMLVVHGVFRNNHLVIENNDLSTTSSKPQCYGFQTAGGLAGAEFHLVQFKRNRITTPGQTAAEFSCCADCEFSDNLLVNGELSLSTSDCNAGSFQSGKQTVQNNTIYGGELTIGSHGTGPYDLDNNAIFTDSPSCTSTQQLGRNDNNFCRSRGGAAASAVFVDAPHGDFRPAAGGPLVGAGSATHYSPLAIGSAVWSPIDPGVARTQPIDVGAFIH